MAMYNEITVTAELTNTEYMITKNYNLLQNKPQINSVELMGNKSLEDLGINPDAEENVIDVVKVNGSALTPDANKAVNVTVTTGSDNGTVKVNGSDVAVNGLKSAAFTEATAYDAAGSAAEVQGNVDVLTVVVNGKVDKVQGKGLSQNDFTNAYKTKLDGIEAGAQVNTVTSVAGKTGAVNLSKSDVGLGNVDNTSDLNKPISTATQTALNGKVDKVSGKGLSTNDYTTAEKNKLAGISENAKNVSIEQVVTDGTTLANITIDGVTTPIKGSDIEVDSEPSDTSTNPLQNKAIYDLINNLLPEATASGNPISIDNASGFNAKSAKVTMLPIQSGSGDPSPTNIRTISGRNSVELTRTGKNIVNTALAEIGTAWNGGSNSARARLIIPCNPSTTYTFSRNASLTVSNLYVASTPTIPASSAGVDLTNITTRTFTTGASDKYIVIAFSQTAITQTNVDDMLLQIELGETASSYESFNGQTHTATFPSTVYGGEYDFVEGGLTDSFVKTTITSFTDLDTTATNPNGNAFYTTIDGVEKKIGNVSDKFVYSGVNRNLMPLYSFCGSSGSPKTIYFILPSDIDTLEKGNSWLANNPVEVCLRKATPTETTLTPQSIALNKGDNVITTDGDNAELKYSVSLDSLLPT